jgi:hypothetical protein
MVEALPVLENSKLLRSKAMAGPGNDLVQVFSTGRANHWEFLRLRTGFELPSSWRTLPAYSAHLNRNILDFMRWPQIDNNRENRGGQTVENSEIGLFWR